ncbi:type II secretion system F family protein [candidate division KSB1 bacterium]|nr:type II secretion system F family protein [candidate division KSB1 bacterium]
MSIYLILAITFLTFFTILYIILRLARRRFDPNVRRMKEMEENRPGGEELMKTTENGKAWPSHFSLERILDEMGRMAQGKAKPDSKLKSTLIAAGYYSEEIYGRFMGIKIFSALAGFIVFIYLGSLGTRPLHVVVLLAIVAAAVFFLLPDSILTFRMRKRQSEIANSLPDALDLLVISVEAGLGLNAAVMRVGQDMVLRCRPLSEEFMRTTQDLRTGITREKAMRALAERNRVEDLKILVGALVLADRLGTSIADTLRAQADSLRTRIQQKAEEQAAKAGVKMLLPLVIFIFPALFIVLMGPAVIMMMDTLSK